MTWTDDPVRDWDRYCEEQDREIRKYPRCDKCGEHITDYIYDVCGWKYCEDCMNKTFRIDAELLREDGDE